MLTNSYVDPINHLAAFALAGTRPGACYIYCANLKKDNTYSAYHPTTGSFPNDKLQFPSEEMRMGCVSSLQWMYSCDWKEMKNSGTSFL